MVQDQSVVAVVKKKPTNEPQYGKTPARIMNTCNDDDFMIRESSENSHHCLDETE